MNKLMLAAAAVATMAGSAQAADLLVGPGLIETDPSGVSADATFYVGGLSLTDYYDDANSFTGTVFGLAARAGTTLAPSISGQLDLSAEFVTNSDDSSYDYSSMNAAGHLNWREDGHLIGVMGSVGRTTDTEMGGTFATLALEGQVDVGPVQLYGQGGVVRSLSTDDVDYDVTAPYVRGEARYFIDPNFMVSANAGYAQITYDGPDEPIDAFSWGATAEYKFEDSPFSVYASYQGNYETEPAEDEDWTKHAVLVGVRVSTDTLEGAARSGVTLRDHNPITGYDNLRFSNWE